MSYALKRAGLASLISAYAFVRGRAQKVPPQPKRVLVMQMAKIGDMICTTPVFRAVKGAYPASHLSVLGNSINKAVVEGNADMDEYLVFDGFQSTIKKLRGGKFDIILLTGPDLTSLACAFLAGAPCIIAPRVEGGVSPLMDRWYRSALRYAIAVPHHMERYAPREYLRLLEPLGIHTDDTKKHLSYTPAAMTAVQAFLAEHGLAAQHPLVGILPGAGNKVKRWPPERFAEVAAELTDTGARVMLIGGPADAEDAREVMAALTDATRPKIINTCSAFSFDEAKALIASLDLLVGVDTGPIYVAEAFGVPTVDIVGPVDERVQPPIGPKHLVIMPPGPRVPQISIMNSHRFDAAELQRQILSIETSLVIDACRKLLML